MVVTFCSSMLSVDVALGELRRRDERWMRGEGEEMRSRRAGKIRCTGNAECHTELTEDENDIKSSLVSINSMLMHANWSMHVSGRLCSQDGAMPHCARHIPPVA